MGHLGTKYCFAGPFKGNITSHGQMRHKCREALYEVPVFEGASHPDPGSLNEIQASLADYCTCTNKTTSLTFTLTSKFLCSAPGTAVVTMGKAGLWTDSRYWTQAEQEMDCNWELHKEGKGAAWICSLCPGTRSTVSSGCTR